MENFKITDLKTNKQIQFMNNKVFFIGKIIKIEEKFLVVSISNLQDNFIIFNVNAVANFFIVFNNNAYWCNSIVIGCKAGDYSQLVILERPKIINKIERRNWPRVPAILDIEYCILPNNINKLSKVTQMCQRMKKKTFTIDISVGGIAIITYEKIESGKLIFLSFKIKENIVSICSVIRTEANERNANFKTALEFLDIDVNHRNIINEYIGEKMKSNT